MKTTWQRNNSVYGQSRVNPNFKLKVNDQIATGSTETASTLNNQFSSVAHILNANIPKLSDNLTADAKQIRSSFVFLNTEAKEFYDIILSNKCKGSPINEVPSCIYRKFSDILAQVLFSWINEAVASLSYTTHR